MIETIKYLWYKIFSKTCYACSLISIRARNVSDEECCGQPECNNKKKD
jgi:hypothetical protein